MTKPITPQALAAAIATVEAAVDDPRVWLPPDIFHLISRLAPMVNVDLLVQDAQGRTLLTWRDDHHFGQGWHIPGSMIRYKETLHERVHRCALDELGADVTFDPEPIAITELIDPERVERGHLLAILYRCTLAGNPDPARAWRSDQGPPRRDQWAWHDGPPADLLPVHRVYERFLAKP